VQIAWLNEYHRRCEDEVGQYLRDQHKLDAYNWLVTRTSPVPVLNSAADPVSGRNSVVQLLVSPFLVYFLIHND